MGGFFSLKISIYTHISVHSLVDAVPGTDCSKMDVSKGSQYLSLEILLKLCFSVLSGCISDSVKTGKLELPGAHR